MCRHECWRQGWQLRSRGARVHCSCRLRLRICEQAELSVGCVAEQTAEEVLTARGVVCSVEADVDGVGGRVVVGQLDERVIDREGGDILSDSVSRYSEVARHSEVIAYRGVVTNRNCSAVGGADVDVRRRSGCSASTDVDRLGRCGCRGSCAEVVG